MSDSTGERTITPEILLTAYRLGLFPMAEAHDDATIHWYEPRRRGILPLDRFHVPRRLARTARAGRFTITVDRSFREVIQACGEPAPDRPSTWLNDELVELYVELHQRGHAHSVETRIGDELVGGLYGVSLGGAFFGESMFSRATDASKIALADLVTRLVRGGYVLLDTQFITDHLARFGAVEISRQDYRRRLSAALSISAVFPTEGGQPGLPVPAARGSLHPVTQTS